MKLFIPVLPDLDEIYKLESHRIWLQILNIELKQIFLFYYRKLSMKKARRHA
jgi:hypothetical protein